MSSGVARRGAGAQRLRRAFQASTLGCAVLWFGCAAGGPPPPTLPTAEPAPPNTEQAAPDPAPEPLAREREALADERLRSIELEQQLVGLRAALNEAQQRHQQLEEELASSLEEVLRAKASIRGVHSRALATSRIAEVRVGLEARSRALEGADSGELARAAELLERADEELVSENYGGAVYLAEKASDLVRRARPATQAPTQVAREDVVPLVPPLSRTTNSPTNLREGPGVEFERKGLIPVGEELSVLAAAGEWRHVERPTGTRGWVHSRLLDTTEAESGLEPGGSRESDAAASAWRTTERVNLRTGPGLDFEPLAVLGRGETVRVTSRDGDWLAVERGDGQAGWVFAPLMRPLDE